VKLKVEVRRYYFAPTGGAKYCCQCGVYMSVCLSGRILQNTCPNFTKFSVLVAFGRGSVLLWRQCNNVQGLHSGRTELNWPAPSWPSNTTRHWSRALASRSLLAAGLQFANWSSPAVNREHAFIGYFLFHYRLTQPVIRRDTWWMKLNCSTLRSLYSVVIE